MYIKVKGKVIEGAKQMQKGKGIENQAHAKYNKIIINKKVHAEREPIYTKSTDRKNESISRKPEHIARDRQIQIKQPGIGENIQTLKTKNQERQCNVDDTAMVCRR